MKSSTLLHSVVACPARMGLSLEACLTMAKAALPSTITIAAIQSTTWATHFGPLNYLVAIEALLCHCILPRVQFLQTLLLNVLMTCLAAAVNLFALWCAVKARQQPQPVYDSSAAAVLAVWFTLQVYLVNALRSSRPHFTFPCINYCIYTMIAITQVGPTCNTTKYAENFVWLLLQAHLTGYAVAAGVSLFVLPRSNRAITLGTTRKYIASIRGVLSKSQKVFTGGDDRKDFESEGSLKDFSEAFEKLRSLDTKLKGDLELAVRDVGYGNLPGHDLEQCYKHLHGVYLFMSGLRDIVEDVHALRAVPTCNCFEGYPINAAFEDASSLRMEESEHLIKEMSNSLNDFENGLLGEPKHSKAPLENIFSTEKSKASPMSFVSRSANVDKLARELMDFTNNRQWAGLNEKPESNQLCKECCQNIRKAELIGQRTRLVLWHLSKAVLLMLEFADALVSSTHFQRKRIIIPNRLVLSEWLVHMFKSPDPISHSYLADIFDGQTSLNANNLYGQGHRLPQRHTYIRTIRSGIIKVSKLLRSRHSLFGFRAMCASMSIGIVAYLKVSHDFFVRQRVLWAMVMTMIAMKSTNGQTTFEFLLRLIASVAGTIGGIVIWYIVDGHPAGVTVFLFLYMMGSFYFGVVKPRFTLLALVSAVTPLIGVGYVLNVHKLGSAYLDERTTPFYPIYQVAAYRLVNVIAGLFVAYVWTFIPYPLTERSVIRQSMGTCIFLLAQYNAIVTKTLLTPDRLGFDEDMTVDLRKLRLETLHQTQKHLAKLRILSAYLKWTFSMEEELRLSELKDVIRILDQMITHSTTLGFASSLLTFAAPSEDEYADGNITSLNTMATSIDVSVSALCLISASITNDLPLPPYLFLNEALDEVSLPISKSSVPSSALSNDYNMDSNAIAVISAATKMIQLDVQQLIRIVKALCGELDFSAKTLRSNLEPQISYAA